MPCLCGDLCCASCGPAQGNWHCPICNGWASEGCEHIDAETGEIKPEFAAEAERISAEDTAADEEMAQQMYDDDLKGKELYGS